MTAAWVVRAGRSGENEQWNIDHRCASVGWPEIGDLTGCHTKEAVRAMVDAAYSEDTPGQRRNSATQLWAFRQGINPTTWWGRVARIDPNGDAALIDVVGTLIRPATDR